MLCYQWRYKDASCAPQLEKFHISNVSHVTSRWVFSLIWLSMDSVRRIISSEGHGGGQCRVSQKLAGINGRKEPGGAVRRSPATLGRTFPPEQEGNGNSGGTNSAGVGCCVRVSRHLLSLLIELVFYLLSLSSIAILFFFLLKLCPGSASAMALLSGARGGADPHQADPGCVPGGSSRPASPVEVSSGAAEHNPLPEAGIRGRGQPEASVGSSSLSPTLALACHKR